MSYGLNTKWSAILDSHAKDTSVKFAEWVLGKLATTSVDKHKSMDDWYDEFVIEKRLIEKQ